MSFRGGRGGGDRGGFRGGSGGFRGGRGGSYAPAGPPAQILEMGTFMHACEGEVVCTSTNVKIPYFNAPIYNANKTPVGKVDEIFGPLNQVYFTVKPQEGIVAGSYKEGDMFYIGSDKLLPLDRFLPKPKPPPGAAKVKKPAGAGGARGGFRGGRGAPRGGMRGAPRGRGGFGDRGGRGGSRGGGGFRGGSGFGARGSGAPRGRGRGFSR